MNDGIETVVFGACISCRVDDRQVLRDLRVRDHDAVPVKDPAALCGYTDRPCNALVKRTRVIGAAKDLQVIKTADQHGCQYSRYDCQKDRTALKIRFFHHAIIPFLLNCNNKGHL